MKKLIFVVILGSSVLLTNEDSFGQNEPPVQQCILLQNSPDPFEEITSIRFNLNSDCFVRVYVTNEQSGAVTLLVEGDMGAGENGVIFKAAKRPESSSHTEAKYICTLETYDGRGLQYCKKVISMQQEK